MWARPCDALPWFPHLEMGPTPVASLLPLPEQHASPGREQTSELNPGEGMAGALCEQQQLAFYSVLSLGSETPAGEKQDL